MSDLESLAIERLQMASEMSLRMYRQPLVITYSGGKDSDVLLHLAQASGIPFEVLHSHTTADAPQTVHHVRETFRKLEEKGIKCTIDYHRQPDGTLYTTKAQRTGCDCCGFGIHLEKRPHRFDMLRERNPKGWEFWMYRCCTDPVTGEKFGWGRVLDYIGVEWETPCCEQMRMEGV